MKVDLHVHTKYSDGEFSTGEIIALAKRENIDVISITDHDCIEAFIEPDRKEIEGIKIIPGIEISTMEQCAIHILGYFIDIHNKELLQETEKIKISRIREIKQVIKMLKNNVDEGISAKDIINREKVLSMDSVADYLWKKGYSYSREDSYEKFLTAGKCAFVQKECLEPKRAIEIIIKSGGIPILAHPNRLRLSMEEKEELIVRLIQYGLQGIEIYCREMNNVEWYMEICKRYNLKYTGGSDFHKKGDRLGYWSENNLIPSDVYTDLCK